MKDKKQKNEQNAGAIAAKPKKKKKVLIVVLVIVAVLVVWIGTSIHNATKQAAMAVNTVEVEPVQKRDLSDTISVKGTVAGASSTNVTSKAASEITSMNVQVGDIVKEGDVLCTLDSTSIEEKIADLEKSMSNANAVSSINTQQAADALHILREQNQRLRLQAAVQHPVRDGNLRCVKGGVRQKQSALRRCLQQGVKALPFQPLEQPVEDAQTAYDTAVETTNRAIETAQEAQELNKYKDTDTTSKDTLSNLKEQLADCEITAPCGGVVTAVNSKVGDINAEKNVIMTIEDTSSLKMVATVQEADVLKLQEGMEATVTADATGDEQIKGTVTRVVRVKSQGTTGSDGSTTSAGGYSIEIALDNQELLIGMAVKAKVMIQAKGEVLAVPYDLIQYDDNGQAYVLVAEADDGGNATAVRRNITVGDEVDYYTEVTGGDLAEGDMLIYDTTFSIAEGQTFTPEQMYSEQDMGLTDGTGTEVSE